MTCEKVAQVHAFYDGELDTSRRQMFEAHLEHCAECRRLLDELQELSSIVRRHPRREMPLAAMNRIHGTGVERDRGVLRIAGWLTASAAMLLVGGLLTGPRKPAATPAKPGIWEAMAVIPPMQTQGEANSELVQVASGWRTISR